STRPVGRAGDVVVLHAILAAGRRGLEAPVKFAASTAAALYRAVQVKDATGLRRDRTGQCGHPSFRKSRVRSSRPGSQIDWIKMKRPSRRENNRDRWGLFEPPT